MNLLDGLTVGTKWGEGVILQTQICDDSMLAAVLIFNNDTIRIIITDILQFNEKDLDRIKKNGTKINKAIIKTLNRFEIMDI